MNWALTRTLHFAWCCIFLFSDLHSFCEAEFEIDVPSSPLVAIHGHSTILSCAFPVGGAFDLESSVITWQRHLEVVHSFYHGHDQLDLQSPRYANRTSLYHSELGWGNASLRLDHTTPEDAGEYTCAISTLIGSQKKSFPVKIAAFYTEPRLQLTASPQSVELKLTSRGFPSPEVRWLDGAGAELSNGTRTELLTDEQGLYVVSSSLTQDRGGNSTLTFVLWNKDLAQEIRREFSLQSEAGVVVRDESRTVLYAVLSIIFLLAVLGILLLLQKRHCFPGRGCYSHCGGNQCLEKGSQSSEEESKLRTGQAV